MEEKKQIRRRVLIVSLVGTVIYSIYCARIMIELPFLAWFEVLKPVRKLCSGNLHFVDLFSRYGEHGLFGYNLLLLMNVKLFHFTTLFDVVINDIAVFICGFLIIHAVLTTLNNTKTWIKWIAAILVAIPMFYFFQGSSQDMETQVRLGILFFLIAMYFVDRIFRNTECSKRFFIGTIIAILLSINIFGTMYSFAGVPCVWLITLYILIKGKKINRNNSIVSIVYVATIPLYLAEYRISLSYLRGKSSGKSFGIIDFIKSMSAWCANGFTGWAFHESEAYHHRVYLLFGAFILLLSLFCIWLFFKSKMCENSWLPLMGIFYSLGVGVMIYIGRGESWEWMTNNWYTVHIRLLPACMIWILIYSIVNSKALIGEKKNSLSIISCVTGSAIIICFIGIISTGNYYSAVRAKYEKEWYQDMQKYLFVQDEIDMPVDDNGQTPLLNTLDKTMNTIKLLRENNLSVYRYWNAYKKAPGVVTGEITFQDGHWDDGWVEPETSFKTLLDDDEGIIINYYAKKAQLIDVYVNNELVIDDYQMKKGSGKIKLNNIDSGIVTVTLDSNYSEALAEPDDRVASYIISDIKKTR